MNKNKIICKKIKKSVGNIILVTIYKIMKKKSYIPQTKVKNPEPKKKGIDWVIWAAWADRVTFEEIKEKSGLREAEVIKLMRNQLKPSSFRLWRKRVKNKSIKHRRKFEIGRRELRKKINKKDFEL